MDEIKVQFPRPCDEAWEDMTPTGCNRHCTACDKVIHDLEQMTGEEAQALLESNDEACVRAKIGPDGAVRLADVHQLGAPKFRTAAIGAAASLALAACATDKSPSYGFPFETTSQASTVTGTLAPSDVGSKVVLSGNGITLENEASDAGRYQFTNVKPGFYEVKVGETVEEDCEFERTAFVEVTEDQTFISKFELRDPCPVIIVGKMEPASPPERA